MLILTRKRAIVVGPPSPAHAPTGAVLTVAIGQNRTIRGRTVDRALNRGCASARLSWRTGVSTANGSRSSGRGCSAVTLARARRLSYRINAYQGLRLPVVLVGLDAQVAEDGHPRAATRPEGAIDPSFSGLSTPLPRFARPPRLAQPAPSADSARGSATPRSRHAPQVTSPAVRAGAAYPQPRRRRDARGRRCSAPASSRSRAPDGRACPTRRQPRERVPNAIGASKERATEATRRVGAQAHAEIDLRLTAAQRAVSGTVDAPQAEVALHGMGETF